MATGTDTYKGLAVPLYGESTITQQTAADDMLTLTGASSQTGDFLVCENSSGTERVWINADGCIYSRGATVTSTAYLGLDARGTVDAAATGTWFATVGARMTTSMVNAEGAQVYALYGAVYDTGQVTGGRMHVLGLYYTLTTAATGACSFIYMAQAGGSGHVPYLFHLGGVTVGSGCFVTATNSVIDHALKIRIDETDYYIGLYDATS